MVQRTAVNPWTWSEQFGFNQGEIVEGGRRVLFCAGQTSVDGEGSPQFAGDMAAQISLAVDNLEAVLTGAGMSLANVIRLNIYTTDVDAYLANAGGALGETDGCCRRRAAGHAARRCAPRLPGADGGARGDRGRVTLTPPHSP